MMLRDHELAVRPTRKWGPLPGGALVIRPQLFGGSDAAHVSEPRSLWRRAMHWLVGPAALAVGIVLLARAGPHALGIALPLALIAGGVAIYWLQPGTLLYEADGELGQRLFYGARYAVPSNTVQSIIVGEVCVADLRFPAVLFQGRSGRILMRHLNARYRYADLEHLARRAGVELTS